MPTRGMERWLTQRMFDRLGATRAADGICANVDFPSPRALVGDAIATASGIDARRRPVAAGADGLAAARRRRRRRSTSRGRRSLAAHLDAASDERRARRFATVRHLADLFDRYALHRPELVDAWAAGAAPTTTGRRSCGGACASGSARPGRPSGSQRACARLRAEPALLDLPPRLALFGLTRLPAGPPRGAARARRAPRRPPVPAASVAGAVGASRGRRCTSRSSGAPRTRRRRCRRTGCSPPGATTSRELQLVLGATGEHADHHHPVEHRAARCSPGSRPASAPTARPTRAGRPAGDRSVAGPRLPRPRAPGRGPARRDPAPARRGPDARAARRDRHVPRHRGVRAADPRDVRRRRGRRDDDDELPAELRPPDLRVRLADRSLRQTNPILGVVARLLELAERAADRLAGARPRRPRAGAPALPARRRRPRADRGLGRRRAGSAGASTPRTARRSSSTRCRRARGAPGLDRCSSA